MARDDSGQQVAATTAPTTRLTSTLAPLALATGFVLCTVLLGSLALALAWIAVLAVFVTPGMVLAARWFSGLERWLVGAGLGYLLSSVLLSALIRAELMNLATVMVGLLGLTLLARVLVGSHRPGTDVSLRLSSDTLAGWGATMMVTLAIVTLPFLRVGSSVAAGVAYRAYFSADLMTHLSVVAELSKGVFPLENPFFHGEPLGYYWLFFSFPALVASVLPISNQGSLLALYVAGGLLFSGLFFLVARELLSAAANNWKAFFATVVALAAVSYEGLLALVVFPLQGGNAAAFHNMNVDAAGRWWFELVSLDGLHRGLLYTPQHLFSYSLLLILILLVARDVRGRDSALLVGLLLGGMATTSIVTAMLAGPWWVAVLWRRRGLSRSFMSEAFLGTTAALLLLAWCVALGFFGDAGGSLTLRIPRLAELPAVLFLDAGALIFLMLLVRKRALTGVSGSLMALAAIALGAVLFLDIRGYEGIWMAWRAGSVMLVALSLLASRAFEAPARYLHGLIIAPAFLTVMLDVTNAQDVTNRNMSAGDFRWTTVVSAEEWEALAWIREQTPWDAVVQWDTRAREPGDWAPIPALAERRMAVGFPIFLLDLQKYRRRERRDVRPIFVSGDAAEAHRLALDSGIDYIFVGQQEMLVRGELLRPLFEAPQRFERVFANNGVSIWRVLSP